MYVLKRANNKNFGIGLTIVSTYEPPYLLSARACKQYRNEMSNSDHEELLREILRSKAKFKIS